MSRISRLTLIAAPLLVLGAEAAIADDTPAPAGETPTARQANRTPGQALDDGAITTKVKSQLIVDKATKARHISVETREGVVSLRGQVDSADERVRAVDIARNTKGVRSVDDELTVAH